MILAHFRCFLRKNGVFCAIFDSMPMSRLSFLSVRQSLSWRRKGALFSCKVEHKVEHKSVGNFLTFGNEIIVRKVGVGVRKSAQRMPHELLDCNVRYAALRAPCVERRPQIVQLVRGQYLGELLAHHLDRCHLQLRDALQIGAQYGVDGDLLVFHLAVLALGISRLNERSFDDCRLILHRPHACVQRHGEHDFVLGAPDMRKQLCFLLAGKGGAVFALVFLPEYHVHGIARQYTVLDCRLKGEIEQRKDVLRRPGDALFVHLVDEFLTLLGRDLF